MITPLNIIYAQCFSLFPSERAQLTKIEHEKYEKLFLLSLSIRVIICLVSTFIKCVEMHLYQLEL